MVRCTKGVVSSKPVTVKPNIAVVSKPTNVEVGPAQVEKEKLISYTTTFLCVINYLNLSSKKCFVFQLRLSWRNN